LKRDNKKLDLHVWVQQLFCQCVEKLQLEWDKNHQPSLILEQNKAQYMNVIENRLKYGFTSAAEARILANTVKEAIRQKSLKDVQTQRVEDVKSLVWTTNSETVRMKYFIELAKNVANGGKTEAIKHFANPRKSIERWYRSKVDSYFPRSYEQYFSETSERHRTFVCSKLKKSRTFIELYEFVDNYVETTASMLNVQHQFLTERESFEVLKETIIDCLQKVKGDICETALPSSDDEVMSRLGCTECCFWCGAICWGQRGHDQNADETKKHHTSHQPCGLARIVNKVSDRLVACPCHATIDDCRVYFGDYRETGMTWQEAKTKHFSNWTFKNHCYVKLDDLMRWFFQELHISITEENGDNLKPADPDELKKYHCVNLSLKQILARLELEIN
jgi:hypothetical protein